MNDAGVIAIAFGAALFLVHRKIAFALPAPAPTPAPARNVGGVRPTTSRDVAGAIGTAGGAIAGAAICSSTGVGVAAIPACATVGGIVGGTVVNYAYEPVKDAGSWVAGKIRSIF